jgi:aminoglycoside phosphotransferase (APT) family kinase protein
MARQFLTMAELGNLIGGTFGPTRRLQKAERLRGGSRKGVYRLVFDGGFTSVAYVWTAAENYWPDAPPSLGPADPFSPAGSGIELFEASQRCLESLGVQTPRVYATGRVTGPSPRAFALVQDVAGGSLEVLLQRGPGAASSALGQLHDILVTMSRHQRGAIGKVAYVHENDRSTRPCGQVVLDHALRDLAFASEQLEALRNVRTKLSAALAPLGDLAPRDKYGLVHGELGPDHVLIDEGGRPVLIDIEGMMFFDPEWEHAYLQLRLGDHYGTLAVPDLDVDRVRLYLLAHHLSLVAGPLRLLDGGDWPEPGPMMSIVEHNLERTLSFVS